MVANAKNSGDADKAFDEFKQGNKEVDLTESVSRISFLIIFLNRMA